MEIIGEWLPNIFGIIRLGSDMSKYNDRYDILSFRQQMLNQTIRYSVPSPNSGY